ncbi:MAG TPA: NAD(P)H-dependent oxidoreductase [Methylomirabilota bacterium]|nr:NAD(P)H-dependent oxidoreductase [Methylomirabilota bacterium]
MNVLVVYCHPCPDSFGAAMKAAALDGLADAGHVVRLADLYAEGFRPDMTEDERRRYHDAGLNETGVEPHIADLRWAEALVFVYPTWWYGLPAMLKGWLDRVLVPHVAFAMPTETHGIRANLTQIRRLVVVTSCGASWWMSKLVGEPGRRTLLRGLRAICHPLCRSRYLALYRMDTISAKARRAHLTRIRRTLASLR